MSKTLKLEISVADLGQNGVVVSEFATTDYVANELSKKATLNDEGKVDPSLLPDYTYLDGLVDKLDDVEQSFLNSDSEILNAAKLYSDNKISENNSKKADLVEGKVPFEQLPFSMNFEQNVSTEFENVRQELRQNSESIVSQMDGLVGSANSYTDGKVLEEREFLNNTINEYKGEVNSQLNNFGNDVDYILKSGASLPYDQDLEYVEGALTLKDGEIQQLVDGVWMTFKKTVDASDVKDESGKTQQQLNIAYTGKRWFAPLYGVKADGVTDDAPALNAIIAQMQIGDILEVLPRNHKIDSAVIVSKTILVTSSSVRYQSQAALFTCSGHGVVFKSPYSKWQGISLVGTQTSLNLDPKNNVFGNIGFKNEYSGSGTSSGVVIEDCFVTYFDTNIAEYAEGTGTWAGAYRDYVRVFSRYGRIGYATVNGGTFNNWFGGAIQFCSEFGIYSDATAKEYNNTSFHGTAIEKNGKRYPDGNYTLSEVLKTGIYCGKNAKVFLLGSYSEDTTFYTDDGGRIFCFGTHQQMTNSRFFAADAAIEDHGGFGAHKNTVNFKERYSTFFTSLTNATITSVSQERKTARIQSSSNSDVSVSSRSIRLYTLHAKDLQSIKFGFSYRFASGQTANPDLLIEPILRITSATSGRSDASRTNANFPVQLLRRADGKQHSFEFVWVPRKMDGYIDPDAFLGSLTLTLRIKNGESNADFSASALDLYIDNISIDVHANTQLDIETDFLRNGTTANRPSNLGVTEIGAIYYDTTESRNYVWTGSAWVRQKAAGDDLFASYTQAQLSDISHSSNTTYKLTNNFVYNSTNGKMYFRTGTTATSAWRATDGTADIAPA